MSARRLCCPRCKVDVSILVPPGSLFVACPRCGYSKAADMPARVDIVGEDTCPSCGARVNATLDAAGAYSPPKKDDLSVCVSCAAPLSFDEKLRLRRVTPAEILTLHPDEQREVREAQRQVRQRRQWRP